MPTTSEIYDLVVIGGGSGGLVVAAGAAHLGARVLLVEKKALGGDCLYTGCVPSKTLIRSARFAADARRAESLGFTPTSLKFKEDSFASITDRVARVIKRVGEHDAPERFERMGVEILFGTPRFVSPHELEVLPQENRANKSNAPRIYKAKRFCISTGSRPAVPPIEGLKETGFVTNEEVFCIKTLPRRLVVVGGGPIGVELGQAFSRLGSRVTIVQKGPRLLDKEDVEVSDYAACALRAEEVEVLLDTEAKRASRDSNGKSLTIKLRGETRDLPADEILVATGRAPNIEGLDLEAAGVNYDERRIVTDERLRTSAKHIFAAGDVTGHFPFTHMAAYEASVVVRNAFLFYPFTQKTDFRVVPWTTFTDPEIARVGLTEQEAREHHGDDNVHVFRTEFAENDRAHAEEETSGFVKIVCLKRKNEIIGASIVGAHAGELIHEIVLAMKQRLSVNRLGSLIHVYPTLSQVNQQAGLEAVLANLARYRKWLAYYFRWWR